MTGWQRLAAYVSDLQEAMDLSDWLIVVQRQLPDMPDEDGKPPDAQITPSYGRRIAGMRVCADFFDYDPQAQREIVVHELVHLHFEGLWQHCHGSLPDLIGKPAFSIFRDGFRLHMESGIDACAMAWAELLPLPRLSPTPVSIAVEPKEARMAKRKRSGKQKAASRRNLKKARSAKRKK